MYYVRPVDRSPFLNFSIVSDSLRFSWVVSSSHQDSTISQNFDFSTVLRAKDDGETERRVRTE